MKQEHLEALLSQAMDEELSHEDRTRLDQALAQSEEWTVLERDLLAIKELSQDQAPLPSPGVLLSLQEKVDAAYLKKEKKSIWSWFSAQPLLAAALLLLLVCGPFAYQYFREPVPSQPEAVAVDTLRKNVNEAQQQFHAAILKMETQAILRLDEFPEGLAFEYAEHLRMINRTIRDCEALLEGNGELYQVYASLSRAYEFKVKLLEQILAA